GFADPVLADHSHHRPSRYPQVHVSQDRFLLARIPEGDPPEADTVGQLGRHPCRALHVLVIPTADQGPNPTQISQRLGEPLQLLKESDTPGCLLADLGGHHDGQNNIAHGALCGDSLSYDQQCACEISHGEDQLAEDPHDSGSDLTAPQHCSHSTPVLTVLVVNVVAHAQHTQFLGSRGMPGQVQHVLCASGTGGCPATTFPHQRLSPPTGQQRRYGCEGKQ